jgi:RNA polymerase sigma-70 factor (ECF subfamily)
MADKNTNDLHENQADEKFGEQNDQELIRTFKQGKTEVFDHLVKKYYSKIYQLAYRMVSNHDDALDLAQESFIRAYRGLEKFKEESSFYTWLYRICLNLCYNYLKKHRNTKQTFSLDAFNEDKIISVTGANNFQIQNEERLYEKLLQRQRIAQAIQKLPPRQRLIFFMHQYDGMKYEEIAQQLNMSVGGVKATYHHAIMKLREFLRDLLL